MADKWNTDRNGDLDESVAGASDEQIRGVSNDVNDLEDTPDNLADDDDEEDEEPSTF